MTGSRLVSHFGGIGRALSARDYRIYWYSHVFSSHGVWMHRMAVGVLIFQLTGSPAWLGFIGFVYSLPLMFLGPIAGAIADRFGVRRTAIVAIIATVGISGLMGVITLAGLMTPLLLAVLVVVLGVLHAFDFPVRQVLIQLLVGRERMSAAIALNSTTFNTASFTGPVLGAAVLALGEIYVGRAAPGFAFLLYGLSMAALLGSILRTEMRDVPSQGGDFAQLIADMKAGLRYVHDDKAMRLCVLFWVLISLLAKSYMDLLPGYALAVFEHGTEGVGTLMAASGAGALCLSIFMAVRGRTEGLTLFLILSCLGGSLALLFFTFFTDLGMASLMMAFVGGGFVVAGIAAQSLVQNSTENAFRARVISFYFALISGAQAIGTLLIGWIAEFLGFQAALGAAAVLSVAVVAALAPSLLRRSDALEGTRPATAAARPAE